MLVGKRNEVLKNGSGEEECIYVKQETNDKNF